LLRVQRPRRKFWQTAWSPELEASRWSTAGEPRNVDGDVGR